jgi:hypothetical protein
MILQVTQADINTAQDIFSMNDFSLIYNGLNCPIAQSLKRQKIPFNYVGGNYIDTHANINIRLPQKAIDFIADFDKGYSVKPIYFRIKKPT